MIMDIHDPPEISEMMTPQPASIRPTWRNHADGEIPAGANRQSAIDDLAEYYSLAANRSTMSNDLEKQAWNAFLSVVFFAAYNPDSST